MFHFSLKKKKRFVNLSQQPISQTLKKHSDTMLTCVFQSSNRKLFSHDKQIFQLHPKKTFPLTLAWIY